MKLIPSINLVKRVFTLKNLLKSLLGQEQTLPLNWNVKYPDGISSVNGFKLPKKIIIENNEDATRDN